MSTVDSVCYSRILTMLLKINKATYFTGSTGVGKSNLINDYLNKNSIPMKLAPINMCFSAQTTSKQLQSFIESKLENKRGKKFIGSKGGKSCLIFVDDINMPMVEEYGA